MTCRVLIIDDEEPFATALMERLRIRGLEALSVTDPSIGLEKISTFGPDVVILDLVLPGLSGLSLMAEIHARDPHLPVILLTGKGTMRDGMESMRLGAFDYLLKPISIEDLMASIRAAAEAYGKTCGPDAETASGKDGKPSPQARGRRTRGIPSSPGAPFPGSAPEKGDTLP